MVNDLNKVYWSFLSSFGCFLLFSFRCNCCLRLDSQKLWKLYYLFITLFLRMVALNLSKSLRLALLCWAWTFFPNGEFSHLACNPSFSITALTDPVLAPLPILSTCPVNLSLLVGMTCLLMCCPSTNTLFSLMISTITASFPSKGPKFILATLPTSTNLVKV